MLNHIKIGLSQIGVMTHYGKDNNPRILEYFREIGAGWVEDDEVAWCSAFVNWVLLKAGYPYSNKLNAKSFLQYGEKTDKPQMGDIVVFWRIAKNSPFGHVGFYIAETMNGIYILGGNQNNEVNIQKFPKTNLLEYRTFPKKSLTNN